MREASNLRMLERGQTPLLGDSNPLLLEGGAGTGVELKDDNVASGMYYVGNLVFSIGRISSLSNLTDSSST